MTPGRWVGVAALVVALLFALLGGEYGILDHRELQQLVAVEEDSIAVLEHDVDSLTGYLKAILTDPEVQERIARERLGMIRPGEFVYRINREP